MSASNSSCSQSGNSSDGTANVNAFYCTPPPSNLHLVGNMINSTISKAKLKSKSKDKTRAAQLSEQPTPAVNCDDIDEIDDVSEAFLRDCACSQLADGRNADKDPRLETWNRVLEQRNAIAARIMNQTGKAPCQLLFNRTATVNDRDKIMVQRLLEHAERMKPSKRFLMRRGVFFDRCAGGQQHMELMSTAPPPRRYFEISGIPECAKREMLGENCCCRRSRWLSSRTVQEGIKQRGNDIKRVLPFFPDIDQLQVIGSKMPLHSRCELCCASSSDYNVNDFNGAVCVMPTKSLGLDLERCLDKFTDSSNSDFNIYSNSISNLAKCHELFWN